MQNDVYLEHAKKIAQAGVKYYIEVANMPTTNDALRYLMDCGLIVAPSKAVNAGGVANSALEMAQNSERMVWTAQEVDKQLRQIMNTLSLIHIFIILEPAYISYLQLARAAHALSLIHI